MLRAVSLLALCSLAAGAQCPPLGSVNFLIPHESDCSKFYICAHGSPVLQSCPEGTHFSAVFMNCQSPIFAGCAAELPGSELPCTWPGSIVSKPHPKSCNKYYVCEYGQAHVFNCPEGLEFNANLQECLWPHEANCSAQISQPRPDALQNGESAQDGGQQNVACESGATLAHDDCSKYYICDHGALVEIDCPVGLQWNSKLEQCLWPHESDCTLTSQKCKEGSLSSHKDCNKYTICNHGESVVVDCPLGLQWSSKDKQCVWAHESDCQNISQDGAETDASQDGGFQNGACEEGVVSHEDCSKYTICNHGEAVVMDCPGGLHWNSKLQICDWPLTAGCA